MFLPNSHSFSLVKSVTLKPVIQACLEESAASPSASSSSGFGKKMFLPNSHSFLLVRPVISKPVIKFVAQASTASLPVTTSSDSGKKMLLPNAHSFQLVRPVGTKPDIRSGAQGLAASLQSTSSSDSGEPTINDTDKRTFLKVAGVAGASIAASLLLPKKAEAFVMGSSPTTGVVGIKDSTNARINPATEETLNEVLKTTDLTFDAGSLQVKVTSLPGSSSSFSDSGDVARSALVDTDRHVQVDVLSSALPSSASTESTLQTISFGGYKFALRLDTDGSIDYVGEAAIGTATSAPLWRVKKIDSTNGVVVQWAGTGVFNQVWDNRASLTYS